MTITSIAVCTACGEPSPTLAVRPSGSVECLPCYQAGLAYGHQHVDHEVPVQHCPLCPTVYGRIAYATVAEQRQADRDEHNARNRRRY